MTSKNATPRGSRQRGMSLVELMLVTVPLCGLSIVLASSVAATSTAKNKSMWKASLQVQQATRQPCGGAPLTFVPAATPKYKDFLQGHQKALIPSLVGEDILLTNQQTQQVTEAAPKFYFEAAARTMLPDRTMQAQNSATFLCNEPNNGNSRRGIKEAILTGIAYEKSQELY